MAGADQRFYASGYGRFTSPDPYQASGGPASPASWNRYSYTRGDPINRTDRKGLADWEVTVEEQICGTYSYDAACEGNSGAGTSRSDGGSGSGDDHAGAGGGGDGFDQLNTDLMFEAHAFATRLRDGSISKPCSDLLANSKIDLAAWADALDKVNVQDGLGNQTSSTVLFVPGSAEYEAASSRSLVIGGNFGKTSGTHAVASLVSNGVWIDPTKLAKYNEEQLGGLIAHETLHNLGLKDGAIQEALAGC
jgi:hypothetical protein